MSAKDILEYQMKVFHEEMQKYVKKKGTKLVFIHGKGDGVLRKNIEQALRHKYKSCLYQDASFKEYGYGATMVTIR
jgi:dsDNA-specific endonuclease/ATPase MutS2